MANYTPPVDNDELAKRWLKRARESQLGHYAMVDSQSSKHVTLGLITIIITACLGITNVFTDLPEPFKIGLGILGLIASFVTAMQTFFQFEEKANSHRLAAIEYGKIRRKLEAAIASGIISTDLTNEIRARLDELAANSPNIPEKFHVETKEKVEK
ncbi:SLATT domain-containing protein [Azotobacter chroococcum]|uniref:SLATT domain-containing protein n=1 Tax=Azotobacter chroococcum TaxID=353 RepID=A0AA43ZA08_9GAMM|nr:SLATT domain-containing protein [Azotobacter chroococcum]NHN79709.1 SLATT domain-containing protein [Azotobacter chroococcum]